MTTVQLLHRIGRRGRTGDFTKLSLSELGDLLEAANSAIADAYNALPTYFKELTEGFTLPAPQAITVAVTNGSNQLSSDVFTPEQFGRSVQLDGDEAWNQIIGTDRLLNAYMGETATVNGNIYGDAVYSDRYPFDRIIGNPQFANKTAGFFLGTGGLTRWLGSNLLWPFEQNIGRPQTWWTQALGNSQGNEPIIVMRFAPAPDKAYAINCRIAYWAKRLLFSDYQNATTLPVPDQFLEKCIIPLATKALMSTPTWVTRSPKDDDRVEARALEAITFLKEQPGQQSPDNRIFTPAGF